jgi:hypothetical protein
MLRQDVRLNACPHFRLLMQLHAFKYDLSTIQTVYTTYRLLMYAVYLRDRICYLCLQCDFFEI